MEHDSTTKLANRMQLKRDIFLEDVCKNDQSVRFYTGIPLIGLSFRELFEANGKKKLVQYMRQFSDIYPE